MAGAEDERLRDALLELDAITRRLRRECPWDREQDERSIVPHTVEEAYELADAAHSGDDAKLLDELGDVLFQVYFLSLLLEERGAGDLAAVATATPREAGAPPSPRLRRRATLAELPTEADDAAEVQAELGRDQAARARGHATVAGGPARADSTRASGSSDRPARPSPRPPSPGWRRCARPSHRTRNQGPTSCTRLVGDLLLSVVDVAADAQRRPGDRPAPKGGRQL